MRHYRPHNSSRLVVVSWLLVCLAPDAMNTSQGERRLTFWKLWWWWWQWWLWLREITFRHAQLQRWTSSIVDYSTCAMFFMKISACRQHFPVLLLSKVQLRRSASDGHAPLHDYNTTVRLCCSREVYDMIYG